jgi:hypothetical protein
MLTARRCLKPGRLRVELIASPLQRLYTLGFSGFTLLACCSEGPIGLLELLAVFAPGSRKQGAKSVWSRREEGIDDRFPLGLSERTRSEGELFRNHFQAVEGERLASG